MCTHSVQVGVAEQLAEGGPRHAPENLLGEPGLEGAGGTHAAHVV